MTNKLDILLLLALPASGKSEVRRYLDNLSPQECQSEFGIGHTVQLDDFPYVHMMRRISQEQTSRGYEGSFFLSDALPFREPRDWGTLIQLVNEDYEDLISQHRPKPKSAAEWLCDRLDAARVKVGANPSLSAMPTDLRKQITGALEEEAADLLSKKNAGIPSDLDGKTVVIEFARGGADGSTMPLPAPYGYRYSLAQLSDAILAKSSVLYIWVTPEESRRKNEARTDPDDPGSILHHGVPNAVMYGDYGCDDIAWLLENSDRPDTVRVEAHGQTYHLPLGRFDNRVDKTTFVREPTEQWRDDDVSALRSGLQEAFRQLTHGHDG